MSGRPQLQRDYKTLPLQEEAGDYSSSRRFWGMITMSFALLGGSLYLFSVNSFIPSTTVSESEATVPAPAAVNTPLNLPLALPERQETTFPSNEVTAEQSQWQSVRVRKGDNLAKIFSRAKLSPQVLHEIVTADKTAKKLKHIKPGQTIRFLMNEGKLVSLVQEISKTEQLRVDRQGDTFASEKIVLTPEARVTHAVGTIDSSLYLAAKDAGISDNLIMGLANIFGWDIDFALDIRKGDSFIVAYEELFLDGEKIKDGNIVAAEFINDNKTYRAVQYTDPKGKTGYFTPEGKNMRKDFLRTPVDFTRISSRFGKRFHPVLNRMRAHKGVDYAAPRGTPIRATGDGKIIHRARKGGYGKTVIIQHGSGKQTLYAHMSSYKRGQRKNSRVRQGQIIGFVGSTGLASGPHLHYEFRINGVHRNPLRIKFNSAKPVAKKFMDDFNYKTSGYTSLLDMLGRTRLALSEAGTR